MLHLRSISLVVVVVVVLVGTSKIEKLDMAEVQNKCDCFFSILCAARSPLEFRRFLLRGPYEILVYPKLKTMSLLGMILMVILVAVSVDANMKEDMDEKKAQEMFNCFFAILCVAKEAEAFRRIMLKGPPELIDLGFKWLKEISNITGSDTPEFWKTYPEKKCPYPENIKFDWFCQWLSNLGEYWARSCSKDANSRKCLEMAAAEHEYNVVTAEYIQRGVCQAGATELANKKAEEGKETMEEGVNKGKEVMGKGMENMGDFANKGGMMGK